MYVTGLLYVRLTWPIFHYVTYETVKVAVCRISRLLAPTLMVKAPVGTTQFCRATSQ